MKILLIGTVEFSSRMLEKLLLLNADVVGLVSMPDNSLNSDYFDFREICLQRRIPHLQTTDINSTDSIQWIKDRSPDIIFCFGWSRLLKRELLALSPCGVIGYHPAELPSNKGRHPLIWALVLGLKRTGSSFFFMDEGADSGDIVSQAIIDIDYKDNARRLYEKVAVTAAEQLEKIYSDLLARSLKRVKQDGAKSNHWRKRGRSDGRIDFRMNSFAIYNLVRALSEPYPGAHIEYAGQDIKVWEVNEVSCQTVENIEPGKIIEIQGNRIFVKAGDNIIELVRHEFQRLPGVGDYL